MRIKKTEIQAVEVVVENYVKCDRCDDRIEQPCHEAFYCSFELKTGLQTQGGGSGTRKSADICKHCAKAVLKLLQDNGIRITEEDWDY